MKENDGVSASDMTTKRDNLSSEDIRSQLPEELTEVLEGVSPQKREVIERMMISQISMFGRVSPEMEAAKKITGEHISTMLHTEDKAMEHAFEDKKHQRWFSLGLVSIGSIVLIILVVLLKDNPDMMEKIITIVLSGLFGGLGGYGIFAAKNKDDK